MREEMRTNWNDITPLGQMPLFAALDSERSESTGRSFLYDP